MKMTAQLSGSEETPPVQTNGKGSFQSTAAANGKSISYRLTYSGLSSRATVAHIHVGPKGVAGGVVVFLCGGGGKPACPASGGTVSGTVTAVSVLATGDVKKGDLGGGIDAGRHERQHLRQRAHDQVQERRDPGTDRKQIAESWPQPGRDTAMTWRRRWSSVRA